MCDLFEIEGKTFKKTFCARVAAFCLEIVRVGCLRNVKFPHTSVCTHRAALEHVLPMLENLKCSLFINMKFSSRRTRIFGGGVAEKNPLSMTRTFGT